MTRRGMTLMELMVGILVTGIATAAGYAAFNGIVATRERAYAATSAIQSAASTRNLISSWLINGQVLRDSGSMVPNIAGIGATEPDDQLKVLTYAPTPLGSQQTQVLLYIDRDQFTPEEGLVAEFTALNQPVDSILQYVVSKKMEINRNVWGLEVTLLDPATKLWVSPLDIGTAAPIGVKVLLHPEWRDTLPALLRLPFVAAQGTTR